ncbi:putative Ig domain-containing protein [Amycolatopsis sp. NPDC026612]|uniref:putative Ig domain-containing protein n=1 Tax=Amycolatopsis sp. NPDC026612 TaxID=3155466 RepID=UPI0033F5F6F0
MSRSPRRILAVAGLAALALTTPAVTATAVAAPAAAAVHPTSRVCATVAKPGMATCFAERQTDTMHALLAPNALPGGFGPSGLRSAYNLTASGSSSATVAIVDSNDDPNAEADLATYRSTYGLPACTTANGCFKKVNENGQSSPLPTADSGWAGEISLDVDMVSAICPNCHILLVEASQPSTADLGTAVNTAVSLGAKYVSNSYGGSEDGSEAGYDSSYFHHPGVAITASTGDSGYGISYPASSQYVTAVGGTSLTQGGGTRGWTETAWSSAGSGCSASVAKPSFQNVTTGCSKRANADVSAVADPQTGVAVYQTYGGSGWAVYGGTSASSPIIASVYALAGNPGASDTPAAYPYSHTGNLNDVTSGSNGSCSVAVLCKAGAGWDGPTGLGTPNGTAAFTSGGSGPGPVTANNPGSQSGTVGTAASLQLSASGGSGGYTWTASGLPAGLSISSAGLISGTPTTAGTSSVTATAKDSTGATASTTFSWTINPTGGSGCSGQQLGNPGFETGTSPWTASTGIITTSADGEAPHTGSYLAYLNGYGSTHTDTVSQSVSIPAGCHATLTYYLHVDSAETTTSSAYDKLTVKAGSTTLATYSNLNKATGYQQRTVDVSAFAGQTVTLTFTGTEDSSLQTSFCIDDTALTLS